MPLMSKYKKNKLFSKKWQCLFGKVRRNNIQGRELQSSRILEYSTNQTQ